MSWVSFCRGARLTLRSSSGVALLVLASLAPGEALAQLAPGAAGVVAGRIVDSENFSPLEGAVVQLRRTSDPRTYRSAVTDSLGEYRFPGLKAATYRLQVRRIGYFADSVEVDLRDSGETPISLGLLPEPLLLPPVEVRANDIEPYLRTERRAETGGLARVVVAHLRQDLNLVSDARELTHGEVVEAATLAETDVFRALQRIPGVSTRDDYTATLWTRGASWDQTRVYFDGLPLYNPTHAGWLFSAINPDAIGSATFYPGVRSARWGEGAAAVLDLHSRRGGEDGKLHGRGELSLASARFAMDGAALDRKLRWTVAARRTFVDALTGVYGVVSNQRDDVIPYDFADLVVRLDGSLGKGWSYTASGIHEQDRLRGAVPGLLSGNQGRWGNRAAQVSIKVPLGAFTATAMAGQTRFRAAISDETDTTRVFRMPVTEPTLPPLESTIQHRVFSVDLAPKSASPLNGWGVGYQLIHDDVRYEGPVSLLSAIAVLLPRGTAAPGGIRSETELGYHALWGEGRWSPSERVSLEAGVRAELGDSVPNGGTARVGPRLSARWRATEASLVTAGWARTYQYTQDVAPVAGPLGPQLHLSHLWVLAEPERYAAMRADIATVGVERWFGDDWLGSVNVYSRRTTGLALPNPLSERVTPDRDPDATARNNADGVELSIRRLTGRWTGSAGYTYGVSRIRGATVTTLENRDTVLADFPSSADVRQAVDATALMRISKPVRVGGAFTYGSGVPFTQLVLPDTSRRGGDVWVGKPNFFRTPRYASLDLMGDYTTTAGAWEITAYAQIRNVLGRDNSVTYARSRDCSAPSPTSARNTFPECTTDSFARGIPRLPLIGVRMSF
ncbi:MAG: TonB-dependent receptor [Gemmatimonadetes bacterium]|nr:TonB-dependent receptor [Gemmatimonadota bacterium]